MRAVVTDAYHQRGSTQHWDRGLIDFRPARPEEHSIPLGARLAEDNQKTVSIKFYIEIATVENADDAIDDYENKADAEFLTHRPAQIILTQST